MCLPSLDGIIFKVQFGSNLRSPIWGKVKGSFTKFAHWASIYPILKWKSLLPGKMVGRRESLSSSCPEVPSLALFIPGPATPDFYALVAQRLEQLVQEQLKSPPSPGEVQRGPGEG